MLLRLSLVRAILPLVLGTLVVGSFAAHAAPLGPYEIVTLGLTDAAHIASDGSRSNDADFFTDSGFAAGWTQRFNDTSDAGRSAWVYDGASYTSARVGYFDADHVRNDGYQSSSVLVLDESGLAVGGSLRFRGASFMGQSAWLHDSAAATTTRLGLLDAGHTRSDGYQFSSADRLNAAGLAAGSSERFSGATVLGRSAWLYDSADDKTTRIGFVDGGHTRSDGYQVSQVDLLNDSNLAAGFSRRFSGASDAGRSTWVHDSTAATTTRVGLFDAVHTRSDGYQYGSVAFLDGGLVGGTSQRFNGASFHGHSAWVYDSAASTTRRAGLVDASHTRSDGYQESGFLTLHRSNLAVGSSMRFNGASHVGQSAWIYDNASTTTRRLGFFDAEHTGIAGLQASGTAFLNDRGLVAGISYRYTGASDMGTTAWMYDHAAATTRRVGFVDAAHTRSDGYRVSSFDLLSNSTFAAGHSERFSGSSSAGQSAWFYDHAAATTTLAGFYDAQHTRNDGYQYSDPFRINDSGFAVGFSERFVGGNPAGLSAWIFDGTAATTTRLGLFDADHTRSDGSQHSYFRGALNDSGFVAGGSYRYSGQYHNGASAWVYDTSSGQQYSIIFSVRSDGYAYSDVSFLGEDGLVLGTYYRFEGEDEELERRAFAWTAVAGSKDLGELVLGGLDAAGWTRIADALRANRLGQILGWGTLASGGNLDYLLRPVPEPGTLLFLAAGLGALAFARRRERR